MRRAEDERSHLAEVEGGEHAVGVLLRAQELLLGVPEHAKLKIALAKPLLPPPVSVVAEFGAVRAKLELPLGVVVHVKHVIQKRPCQPWLLAVLSEVNLVRVDEGVSAMVEHRRGSQANESTAAGDGPRGGETSPAGGAQSALQRRSGSEGGGRGTREPAHGATGAADGATSPRAKLRWRGKR